MDGTRKLIVAAVTLMLCSVVVVGVGYALTTSVTNQGSSVDYEEHTIVLKDNGGDVTEQLLFNSGVIDYSTKITNGATQSIKYDILAQDIELTNGKLTVEAKHGTAALAGNLTIVISSAANLNAIFGDTIKVTVGASGEQAMTWDNSAKTYTYVLNGFDGVSSAVSITGHIDQQLNLTQVPSFSGTFDVSFTLTTA